MSDREPSDNAEAKNFVHAIIPTVIQWVCWVFALASFAGAVYRVCNIMARHGDIDQVLGATTLSYLGAAIGFLLLPYAKSFGILGAKVDFNLEEKATLLSLKVDDLGKLIRYDHRTDESVGNDSGIFSRQDKSHKLISRDLVANELNIQRTTGPRKNRHLTSENVDARIESEVPAGPSSDRLLIQAAEAIPAGKFLEDPWKGQFGGSNIDKNNGRELSATVVPMTNRKEYYEVTLTVASTNSANPLEGSVIFFIHDTFPNPKRLVGVANGVASLELESWGAFTVGALADEGRTRLELDLADDSNFPRKFRSR